MLDETETGTPGRWWLPEAPDRKVPGRYLVTDDGGVEIELFDWIEGPPGTPFAKPVGGRRPLVRGAVRGRQITLVDCWPSTAHAQDQTQSFWATTAIDGLGFDHVEDIRFDWTQVRLTGLDQWLYRKAFDHEINAAGTGFSWVEQDPSDIVATVPGAEIRLRTPTTWRTMPHRGVDLRQENVFEIRTDDEHDHQRLFFRFIRPLRELLRLALMEDVHIEEQHVARRADWTDSRAPRTARLLVHRSLHRRRSREVHPSDFLFTADDWSFAEWCPAWFDIDRRAVVALGLLAASTTGDSTVSTRALEAFGAAEALHRALHPDTDKPSERQAERLARVLAAAPNAKDRDWLKWQLKYSHEPSLRDRLEDLIREVGPNSARLATGRGGPWADAIAKARNTLAHGLETAVQLQTNVDRLYWLAQTATLLVRLRLLREIGFTDEMAHAAVMRHTLLSQTVTQIPRNLADLWW